MSASLLLDAIRRGEPEAELLFRLDGGGWDGEGSAAAADHVTPALCVAAAQAGYGHLLERLADRLEPEHGDSAASTGPVDSPLHWAAFKGLAGAVEVLARRAAAAGGIEWVNFRGQLDSTPLHLAAISGSLEAVKALIYHGGDASLHLRNAYGNIPASLASTATCRQLLVSLAEGGQPAVQQLRADMDAAAAAAQAQREREQQQQEERRRLEEEEEQRQQEAEEAARLAAEEAEAMRIAQEEQERRQAEEAAAVEQERLAAEAAAAAAAAQTAKKKGKSGSPTKKLGSQGSRPTSKARSAAKTAAVMKAVAAAGS
ncbi:hypothetical protein CHLNCDRAFT_134696 [Chlorella variabilis]|uniref:Uncharacterized protein n=1 Tax=Chlorella variabilis TaxID=554065 RepID=E1ZGJ6_CHLVA|nr:hypothetical protein CHLNCDRAFT_134696 [Chlorella variabilis]EFN54769.1 hypothetical protein CHLNCDRAFT_134696 [Chlorella variabilis]|eukprot:XP_005846871.1 hypothetical protein CHLNCDRAFT_134696 [Chlorella variabilis]